MFTRSPESGAFRQGEILSDVVQVHISLDSVNPQAEEIALEEKIHPQAIILTQDCDLDWDFKARDQDEEGNRLQLKLVPNILLCEMIPAETLRGQMRDAGVGGSDLWKRIVGNRDERYHSFPQLPPEADLSAEGLPALVVDFSASSQCRLTSCTPGCGSACVGARSCWVHTSSISARVLDITASGWRCPKSCRHRDRMFRRTPRRWASKSQLGKTKSPTW